MVNAARMVPAVSLTMRGIRSSSSRGPGSAAHMTPLVWRIMKAMLFEVTRSAARIEIATTLRAVVICHDDKTAFG